MLQSMPQEIGMSSLYRALFGELRSGPEAAYVLREKSMDQPVRK
jgi:hypothetical protein